MSRIIACYAGFAISFVASEGLSEGSFFIGCRWVYTTMVKYIRYVRIGVAEFSV